MKTSSSSSPSLLLRKSSVIQNSKFSYILPQGAISVGEEKREFSKRDENPNLNPELGMGSGMGRSMGAGRGRGLGRGPRDGRGQGRTL